jgi:phosphomevalonate kinase
MKEMGNLSGVPIEPDEQTKLLDTCVSQAGVIGGGVPGGMFSKSSEKLDFNS